MTELIGLCFERRTGNNSNNLQLYIHFFPSRSNSHRHTGRSNNLSSFFAKPLACIILFTVLYGFCVYCSLCNSLRVTYFRHCLFASKDIHVGSLVLRFTRMWKLWFIFYFSSFLYKSRTHYRTKKNKNKNASVITTYGHFHLPFSLFFNVN